MRIDFEDMELYLRINHKDFEKYVQEAHLKNIEFYDDCNYEWASKASPYHIFDILWTRNSGLYEIIYDYIKRRTLRNSSVFDLGAGIGTLELLLLKRFPNALTVQEPNLMCMDFIYWRLFRRGAELTPPLPHYDYTVCIDMLQRLPSDEQFNTLQWLTKMGNRLFLYVPEDTKHPLYNDVVINLEEFFKPYKTTYFHGLWDVIIHEQKC